MVSVVLHVENTISHGREGQDIQNFYPLDLKYDVDEVREISESFHGDIQNIFI